MLIPVSDISHGVRQYTHRGAAFAEGRAVWFHISRVGGVQDSGYLPGLDYQLLVFNKKGLKSKVTSVLKAAS